MPSNTPAVRLSTGTQDLIAKVLLGLALAGIVWLVVKRLFRAIPSLWGEGLTDAEARLVDSRFTVGPGNTALYRRQDVNGYFTDATPEQRQRVQDDIPRLRATAQRIADAPGLINDDERAVVNAFLSIPSLFDLLWMNRLFGGLNVPTLNTFPPELGAPEVGVYVDAFAQPADWLAIMQHLSRLPKYL